MNALQSGACQWSGVAISTASKRRGVFEQLAVVVVGLGILGCRAARFQGVGAGRFDLRRVRIAEGDEVRAARQQAAHVAATLSAAAHHGEIQLVVGGSRGGLGAKQDQRPAERCRAHGRCRGREKTASRGVGQGSKLRVEMLSFHRFALRELWRVLRDGYRYGRGPPDLANPAAQGGTCGLSVVPMVISITIVHDSRPSCTTMDWPKNSFRN